MTHYRRYRREGGTYFFTVNLADRSASHLTDHIDVLRNALATTRAERWMQIDAMVVLPDHLHAIWTLPAGDADFSTRWRLIKSRFSRAVGLKQPRTASQVTKKEHGLWQRRFWEHYIRDDADFAAHLAYCWGNPVKHGLVTRAVDWPYSSLHRDIKRGLAGCEWAG
jgi:putative transposase